MLAPHMLKKRGKTWGDHTEVINKSSWRLQNTPQSVCVCVGQLGGRRSLVGHAPHWEVSRQSLYLRGFPYDDFEPNEHDTHMTTWTDERLKKSNVKSQTEGRTLLWTTVLAYMYAFNSLWLSFNWNKKVSLSFCCLLSITFKQTWARKLLPKWETRQFHNWKSRKRADGVRSLRLIVTGALSCYCMILLR